MSGGEWEEGRGEEAEVGHCEGVGVRCRGVMRAERKNRGRGGWCGLGAREEWCEQSISEDTARVTRTRHMDRVGHVMFRMGYLVGYDWPVWAEGY